MDSTQEVLERVNKYLSLVRYDYTTQENLSRLNILKDYYDSLSNNIITIEKLSTKIETAEELSSGNLKLPLKVHGVFLTEGRPKRKYYTTSEMQKAADNPLNQSFKLCLDHKDTEIGSVIGKVTKIWYDDKIKGLKWAGHINNETQAMNVLDGSVSQVSATIYSIEEYDEAYGIIGVDLAFREISLVWDGAEPNNSIIVG